ncbi:MAG TPA: UPF0182 family protein [Bacillota bacterium]
MRSSWFLRVFLALLALVLLSFFVFSEYYTDFMWFGSLGFAGVFTTVLWTKVWLGLVAGTLFGLFIWANLWWAKGRLWQLQGELIEATLGRAVTPRWIKIILTLAAAAIGVIAGINFAAYWEVFLQYLNRVPFGVGDPIFHRDVAFYVFQVPFLEALYGTVMAAIVIAILGSGALYIFNRQINFGRGMPELMPQPMAHLSLLLAAAFLVKAGGYLLRLYGLVYSPRGVVFGASYTDVHAEAPGLKILAVLAIALAIITALNAFLRRTNLPAIGFGVLLAASFLAGTVYPYFVQQFEVTPNELTREEPYIRYTIEFSRLGFGLDQVDEKEFTAQDGLNQQTLAANQGTIENIRIWDRPQLLSTYAQLQGLRPYYRFNDVDVDRYTINGRYRQVTLAARELDKSVLAQQNSDTWVNRHLNFTHGYGLVMSPTTEVTAEGLPLMMVKDIPPKSTVNVAVTRPEIYFGELTDDYVLVDTKQKEFDYPMGDDNAYTTYQGTGGVKLSSPLVKAAFALRLESFQMLLSDVVQRDSRILLYRNIKPTAAAPLTRQAKIAPFLSYDDNPYIVVGDDGGLFWIIDAYTYSGRFPYSERTPEGMNYIRNSVKVVVDAYNGDTTYYVVDPKDPLIQTYQKMFPSLFTSIDQMRPDLRRHIRYPMGLFQVQAERYATYHMLDPIVWYNKEDKWQGVGLTGAGAATDQSSGQSGQKTVPQPEYIIMRIPGQQAEEFVLIMPYTPTTKQNMIAWIAARSDGEHYGQLLVFKFPKQKLVYGPEQIKARINQDPEIVRQLTLWTSANQGDLMVIPIDNSLVYVRPLYLESATNKLPELKRVIVAYGERVVMEPSLGEALARIFGATPITPGPVTPGTPSPGPSTGTGQSAAVRSLIAQANQLYQQAQEAMTRGDWAAYGSAVQNLGQVLKQLQGAGG